MAFTFTWTDKVDNVDFNKAKDVNDLAHGIKEIQAAFNALSVPTKVSQLENDSGYLEKDSGSGASINYGQGYEVYIGASAGINIATGGKVNITGRNGSVFDSEGEVSADFSGKRATNLSAPEADSDAANKKYVDVKVSENSLSVEDDGIGNVTFDSGAPSGNVILDVVQTTGQSETSVMSQKAVTDEVNALKMGIPGGFELLASQELAEKVATISFDLGKTVNELYILCQSQKVSYRDMTDLKKQDGKNIGFWSSDTFSTTVTRYIMSHIYNLDDIFCICETQYGTNSLVCANTNTSYHDFHNGISNLIISNSAGFEVGTIFTVWGR